MLALINRNNEQIVGRYFHGISETDQLRRFCISSSENHLFTQLLRKPQNIRVGHANREKLMPLINEELKQYLTSENYYLSSLFVNDKPIGLIYADGSTRSGSYDYFKQASANLALELGKLSSRKSNSAQTG